MFWIFCNNCFFRPSHNNKRHFFMTSCSHILCSQCTDQSMYHLTHGQYKLKYGFLEILWNFLGATVCRRCQSPCMIVQCNSQVIQFIITHILSPGGGEICMHLIIFGVLDAGRSQRSIYWREWEDPTIDESCGISRWKQIYATGAPQKCC